MTVVEEIKERLDIIEYINQYVPLKKAGRNYQGLCPFHAEKTPSFIVFPDTQSWHCFGACGIGGDIFNFLMRRENIDFPEALRQLAGRAGILLPSQAEESALSKTRKLLVEINEAAAAYFNGLLLGSPAAETARRYLDRRGLTAETIRAFQLGYALDDWHPLERFLGGKGYHAEDVVAAGLLTERDDGGHHDRFRGRLMFPIRDLRGQVVGFGGRVLDDGLPKYLNSPQTALFDKSQVLYAIDLAKEAIRQEGLAVIVEGYMDALMAHQYGLKNVVASLGTALTEEQLATLKRLTKKYAFALDSDAAGDRGTLRGLDTAQKVLDRALVPVPTWKGLIEFESHLDAELRIITLPPGKDPDEVIREDVEHWRRLVTTALPVVEYYFRALTADLDLQSPKGKAEAVKRLQPVIGEIPNAAERAHYVQELARLVKMDERDLAVEIKRPPARAAPPGKKSGKFSGAPTLKLDVEKYLLFLLLRDPELMPKINQALANLNMPPLEYGDFVPIYQAILTASGEHKLDAAGLADEPAWADLQQDWQAFQQYVASWPSNDQLLTALRSALQLRRSRLDQRLLELRYLNEDARRENDSDAAKRWVSLVARCSLEKGRLDEALSKISVLGFKRQEDAPTN
jgi:DNA primase